MSTQTDISATRISERSHESEHSHRHHRHHGHHGRALGVFRQELKQTLSASVRATFATSQSGYGQIKDQASADSVAADTLGAAQRIVAEEPVAASRSIIKFRQTVEEAASYTREIVGNDDDFAEVEGTVGRVLDGLNKMEREAAQNVESSASILAVETESRQRSTIKIRTQEGDVVKLSLKQTSNASATDVAVSNENGSASTTEVEVSSRSRLSLRVEGDLNDAELGAIQNVFSQAESIANEFFGGDLFAALDLAAAFEYDSEQLARVNMRFRSRQVSNTSFAATGPALPEPASSSGPAVPTAGVEPTPKITAGQPDAVSEPAVVVAPPTESVAVEDAAELTEPQQVAANNTALGGFFNLVSNFLRSVAEGFESEAGRNDVTARFHFSQSFKLELLKSVIQVAAPDEPTGGLDLATSLIDSVAGVGEEETVSQA